MTSRQTKGIKAHSDGYKAETKAVLFLRLKGYSILERNYKPPRGSGAGEIDIIALKKGVVIFIEVKYRKTTEDAAYSISEIVQQRRIRGAEYYLMKNPKYANSEMRFDVILMAPNRFPEHIKNAFMS